MSEQKIHKDRLFPKMYGVNINSLKIDWECVSFVTPPYDSRKISEIISKHIKKYKSSLKDVVVVDATACVGGDTITLCNNFGKVIAIEIDTHRYDNLVNNIKQYKFTNAELLNGDSLTIIPNLPIIDVIVVDVPWGGKDYKLKQNLRLNFGNLSLEEFILNSFNKKISITTPKILVSKIPKNYDIKYLYSMLSPELEIILYDQLKKMNIIVVERKTSTNDNIQNNSINSVDSIKSISQNLVENVINKVLNKFDQNKTNANVNQDQNIYTEKWDTSDDFSIYSEQNKKKLN